MYSTNNPSELRSLVTKHSEIFTRDNNMGLVKQCLSSLYKKNIQRLTKVQPCGPSEPGSVPRSLSALRQQHRVPAGPMGTLRGALPGLVWGI